MSVRQHIANLEVTLNAKNARPRSYVFYRIDGNGANFRGIASRRKFRGSNFRSGQPIKRESLHHAKKFRYTRIHVAGNFAGANVRGIACQHFEEIVAFFFIFAAANLSAK